MRARDNHTQRGRAGGDDAMQRNALKAQVPRVLFGLGARRTLTTSGTDGNGRTDGRPVGRLMWYPPVLSGSSF
jgi:hypothetical protein